MPEPQRRRRSAVPPIRPLTPRHPPQETPDLARKLLEDLSSRADPVPGVDPDAAAEAMQVLAQLSRALKSGGMIAVDRPPRGYIFEGEEGHVSIGRHLLKHLWRYRLGGLERDVLDYMIVHHDKGARVHVRQVDLARHLRCSQPRISRAIRTLSGHHFIWVIKRSHYQLHPLFAYGFRSRDQIALVVEIGLDTIKAHPIVPPSHPDPLS